MGGNAARLSGSCADIIALIKMIPIAVKFVLAGCTLAANVYYVLAIVAGYRFSSKRGSPDRTEARPVSILIPLQGADFKAYDNYAGFCR